MLLSGGCADHMMKKRACEQEQETETEHEKVKDKQKGKREDTSSKLTVRLELLTGTTLIRAGGS